MTEESQKREMYGHHDSACFVQKKGNSTRLGQSSEAGVSLDALLASRRSGGLTGARLVNFLGELGGASSVQAIIGRGSDEGGRNGWRYWCRGW